MAKPKRRSEGVKVESDAKRQKVFDSELYAFLESTLKLVTGLPHAIDFLKLPPKKQLPDYYQVIKSPMSIQEIRAKYDSKTYASADDFLADFQLMADNANTYNMEDSEIAKNSILILDFVKDQVSQYSPTKDDTPEDASEKEPTPAPVESTPAKSITRIKIKPPNAPTSSPSVGPSTPGPTPGTPSTPASAMTQKARFLMVLDELINYEVDGVNIGKPFANEVSRREFPDYYKIVKKPMALNNVKDNILAGKVKSMGQFQNQVELVWKNAQLYNNVGSLLYSDSRVLQDYFHDRMAAINREIEAHRVAQLNQRDSPSGMPSIRLKIKAPKTKLSLTLHNRDGGLSIPGELAHGNSLLNPLTGEETPRDVSDSEEEDSDVSEEENEEVKPQTPAIVMPSTKPRVQTKPASEAYIQEIVINSSRSVYKQVVRPIQNTGMPIQPIQNWFEHKIVASDFPVPSYTIPLHRQQGAVTVSAGLHDDLVKKKHHASLTVNGERVNPVPSIHYADSGRQLTSRYELKLPLGLNMVVFDIAVEDPIEESRTRLQEAASMKTEKMTFWLQVL